jgi:hypothetical protein
MATKAALSKAYDAGQAAQWRGVPDDACPFEEGSEEYDAYMEGKSADLAEKWTAGGGTAHTKELGN